MLSTRLIPARLDRSHLVIECVHAVRAAFAYYRHRRRFPTRVPVAIGGSRVFYKFQLLEKNSPITRNIVISPLTTVILIVNKLFHLQVIVSR